MASKEGICNDGFLVPTTDQSQRAREYECHVASPAPTYPKSPKVQVEKHLSKLLEDNGSLPTAEFCQRLGPLTPRDLAQQDRPLARYF
ncbi:MAG: hypothetical protein LQ347_004149 [Umbilicaria vellea]|nr:MAG: hypothetical protein LQ347_004149 [Umbilicaria vellea]